MRRSCPTPIAFVCVVLFACSFAPEPGTYTMEIANHSTDCYDEADTGDAGSFGVEVESGDDNTSFTLLGNLFADTAPVDCALDGHDFVCDIPPFTYPGGTAQFTQTYQFEAWGTWSSTSSFDMTHGYEVTCSGDDCAEVADAGTIVACRWSADSSGTRDE